MDADIQPGLSLGSAMRWRRIPWSVPDGRRVWGWKALPEALLFGALFLSFGGGETFAYEGFATPIAILGIPIFASYVVAAIAVVTYGGYVLATAHVLWARPTSALLVGLVGSPAARRWYGAAYVIPPLIAWGGGFAVWHLADAQLAAIVELAAPAAVVVCILLARGYSNRDVKRAVLAGQAPRFEMSPDGTWWRKGDDWASVNDRVWWNGNAWIGAAADVPDEALRSPDGNYWWTGASWCAMPPIPKRPRRAPRASVTSF